MAYMIRNAIMCTGFAGSEALLTLYSLLAPSDLEHVNRNDSVFTCEAIASHFVAHLMATV